MTETTLAVLQYLRLLLYPTVILGYALLMGQIYTTDKKDLKRLGVIAGNILMLSVLFVLAVLQAMSIHVLDVVRQWGLTWVLIAQGVLVWIYLLRKSSN